MRTIIDSEAFNDCSQLWSITLPATLTTIDNRAFNGCSLKNIRLLGTIPPKFSSDSFSDYNATVTVETEVFDAYLASDWKRFKNLRTYEKTDVGLFKYMIFTDGTAQVTGHNDIELTGAGIPHDLTVKNKTYTVTEVADSAFFGCTKMTTATLPASLTQIGELAFAHCTCLAAIELPESLSSLGNSAFLGCTALSSIKLPMSLTSIDDYTFNNCVNISEITLPTVLTTIGHGAFRRCYGLQTIELHDKLTSIGIDAFNGCNLTDIISHNVRPPKFDVETSFSNYSANVIVPDEGYNDYLASDWQNFYNTKSVSQAGLSVILPDEDVRITVVGRDISVSGVADGTGVSVYNTTGAMGYNGLAHGNIAVASAGVYIVSVDGFSKMYKIIIR